ncbi:MAG: hypothetical protein P1U87_04695 [Verrucomicrobiales bacterium]|nr:hypothetical protein [Verrucomicrobiales bacterium]
MRVLTGNFSGPRARSGLVTPRSVLQGTAAGLERSQLRPEFPKLPQKQANPFAIPVLLRLADAPLRFRNRTKQFPALRYQGGVIHEANPLARISGIVSLHSIGRPSDAEIGNGHIARCFIVSAGDRCGSFERAEADRFPGVDQKVDSRFRPRDRGSGKLEEGGAEIEIGSA